MSLSEKAHLGPLPSSRLLTSSSGLKCSTKCLTERFPSFSNSILRASIEKGLPQLAISHYNSMLLSSTIRPDHRTLSLVLKACRNSSNINAAMSSHARMAKTGFQSHLSLAAALFQVYIQHSRIREAQQVFNEMLKWDSNPVYGNLMLNQLLGGGEFNKAKWVFNALVHRDLVTWNSMIAGCVRSSHPREAITLFFRMIRSGFDPDAFTFSSVLAACARVGAITHGEWVHRLMAEKGFEFNNILVAAIIDMYAKCGRIEVARSIFNSIRRNGVSIWNSMITGLAIHGLGLDAIQLFALMQGEGVAPDGITFLGILTACSHCGMVEDSLQYFDAMKQNYSIEPRIEHYGAMVDALARAGRLEEAYEAVREMPMEPDIMIWRALLTACKRHQRADLAEEVMGKMAVPQCGSGDYVMLSSVYSTTKRWGSAERVWGLMKERGVRKVRGLSWVELGGAVKQFKAGDQSHPESDEVRRLLKELTERIRAEGFVPMTELVTMDVSEEEREENLSSHSEKLAVAYSVLRSSPGTEIKVVKNLQTCGDCHEWIKLVSKVLSRVIIVRDRIRFHRFERGSCSCRDYW